MDITRDVIQDGTPELIEKEHLADDKLIEVSEKEITGLNRIKNFDVLNENNDLINFHLHDAFNISDDCGRILINVTRCVDQKAIYIANEIQDHIKPHQIGGIRFMFDHIINDSGCILAHEMGLGKTLQIISLCDLLLKYTEYKRILCIVPVNTLQNWKNECNVWLPSITALRLHVISDELKTAEERSQVISRWNDNGGIILMGYEQYRFIVMNNLQRKKEHNEKSTDEQFYRSLLKADVLICDEGHRIKNDKSEINVALSQITTKKRIILTGFPVQNHLKEYFCMVEFVRPTYLGTFNEFSELFIKPIERGKYKDSSDHDKKLMMQRAYVLHVLLMPFVQRRCNVLQNTLQGKFDFIIPVGMTLLQKQLLCEFNNQNSNNPNILTAFATCSNICSHPDVLYNSLKKESNGWAHQLLENYKPKRIEESPKMELVFKILEESIEVGDRVLLYSQSLGTLDVIESFLHTKSDIHGILWKKNFNYYRLDGSTSSKQRSELVADFNSNWKVHLFLISTKAGCMGINLVGANRLILFDVSWNPCLDNQAIARIYRYNQTKTCYIYRLVTQYSLERLIYNRQVQKQSTADRIIDRRNPEGYGYFKEKLALYLSEPECKIYAFDFDKYSDSVLIKTIQQFANRIAQEPFEHKNLLLDINAEALQEREKQDALQNYLSQHDKLPVHANTLQAKVAVDEHDEVFSPPKKKLKRFLVEDNLQKHIWIGEDVWKQKGFAAEGLVSPTDVTVTTKNKTATIAKGMKVVFIKDKDRTYMETLDGVYSVPESEIRSKFNLNLK